MEPRKPKTKAVIRLRARTKEEHKVFNQMIAMNANHLEVHPHHGVIKIQDPSSFDGNQPKQNLVYSYEKVFDM